MAEEIEIVSYFKVPRPEDPTKYNIIVGARLPDGSVTSITVREEDLTEAAIIEQARKEWETRKKWLGKRLRL